MIQLMDTVNNKQKRTEHDVEINECVSMEKQKGLQFIMGYFKKIDQKRKYILLLFFILCFLCFIREYYYVFFW